MKKLWCFWLMAPCLFAAEYGIAPSHIAADPNALFRHPEVWREVWSQTALLKIYDVQLRNAKWASQIDPAALSEFLKTSRLKLGVEYGTRFGHGGGAEVAADILNNIAPLEKAGIRVHSIHLDGAVVRTLQHIKSPPNPGAPDRYGLDRVAEEIAALFAALRQARPELKIGLVPNLMNWDWSETVPGALGQWSRESGVNYRDALDRIDAALRRRGEKIDFIEIDAPYNYYKLDKTTSGRKFDGPGLLKEAQSWCRTRQIEFHLIVNCEPREPFGDYPQNASDREKRAGAEVFRRGTETYLRRLGKDGVTPDLLLIQSWYRAPAQVLPVTDRDSFTGIVKDILDKKP
ncbi:MAG: hypothetical protein AB7F32_10745 [Victivallaceae bacterium]